MMSKLLSTLLFLLYTWCQTTFNIALLALNTVSNYFQHCFSCSTHGVKLLSTLLFMLYTWCQTTLNIALLALNTLSNYFRRCSSCSKHGVELFSTLPFLLYYNMNCILTFCNVERYFIEVRDRRTLSQFFQTKLVSFGRWVVLSSLV